MRKDLGAKSMIYPMPVLIIGTYDKNGNPNAMNAAWGGIMDTNQIGICISAGHKTTKNILKNKCFTVSCGTKDTVAKCDYVGMVSGLKVKNKLEKCGFHTHPSDIINAPIIDELPLTLECKLISYDKKTTHLFGKIVNISADSKILTKGVVDIKKLRPLVFNDADHTYHEVGGKVGNAFKDYKKIK